MSLCKECVWCDQDENGMDCTAPLPKCVIHANRVVEDDDEECVCFEKSSGK